MTSCAEVRAGSPAPDEAECVDMLQPMSSDNNLPLISTTPSMPPVCEEAPYVLPEKGYRDSRARNMMDGSPRNCEALASSHSSLGFYMYVICEASRKLWAIEIGTIRQENSGKYQDAFYVPGDSADELNSSPNVPGNSVDVPNTSSTVHGEPQEISRKYPDGFYAPGDSEDEQNMQATVPDDSVDVPKTSATVPGYLDDHRRKAFTVGETIDIDRYRRFFAESFKRHETSTLG
ncbi:unnamed protein product [Heligmosomoides polygyrus]|uniref:Cauli_VI domain-containing protein n=1 Tax=Heligmosomoides polygyrus TaxID=6339 RepID=A0A3P8GN48_HELPZ|nr:unnamed protein product [Heligmosomoides polygyrus]